MTSAVRYAIKDQYYVIQFEGEIRLTYCTALDEHFSELFENESFDKILIDLQKAHFLDSTTYGLIAKLAVKARQHGKTDAVILSSNEDITHTLNTMGFGQLFDIHTNHNCDVSHLTELNAKSSSEAETCSSVIDAHNVLMSLSDDNFKAFKSLVDSLRTHTQVF